MCLWGHLHFKEERDEKKVKGISSSAMTVYPRNLSFLRPWLLLARGEPNWTVCVCVWAGVAQRELPVWLFKRKLPLLPRFLSASQT